MDWVICNGSRIHSMSYVFSTKTLRIRFFNRTRTAPESQYRYEDVSLAVWLILCQATSKGTAFDLLVKKKGIKGVKEPLQTEG